MNALPNPKGGPPPSTRAGVLAGMIAILADISITVPDGGCDRPVEPVRPARGLPRNARCPCGSGRKVKHCCRNRPAGENS